MSTSNTVATLNGMFKEVYAPQLENLIPDGVKLLPKIPFASKEKMPGNYYHQPVILGLEHGVTYGDGSGAVVNLNAAVAGATKDAQVRGNEIFLRSVLSYSAASRALGGGNKAFMDATKFLVGNMMRSISKRLEVQLLYGQMGIGTVASESGSTVTITTAEWAPGIWAGAEGMPVEFRRAGSLVLSATVESVSIANRTITMDVDTGVLQAADVIYHKGAYNNEFAGIHKILSNSSTLFNIDAAAYSLWAGSSYAVSPADQLSFAIIEAAIASAVAKGLEDDVVVVCNPQHWDDLLTEQAAKRMYDSSYSPAAAQDGSKTIKFFGQNGSIEIMPSIYCKEGYAYVLCLSDFMRIGSTDVTFKDPVNGDQFFRHLENSSGYELRCWADMALFCAAPGKSILISGLLI